MSDDRTSYEAEVAVDARVKKKDFYLKGFVSPSIHPSISVAYLGPDCESSSLNRVT